MIISKLNLIHTMDSMVTIESDDGVTLSMLPSDIEYIYRKIYIILASICISNISNGEDISLLFLTKLNELSKDKNFNTITRLFE